MTAKMTSQICVAYWAGVRAALHWVAWYHAGNQYVGHPKDERRLSVELAKVEDLERLVREAIQAEEECDET